MSILIRRLSKSHVTQKYVDWLNDPEINQYLETRLIPQTLDDCMEYVEKMRKDPNQFHFGIFKEVTVTGSSFDQIKNIHVGNIKLGPVNWIHRNGDLSIFIGEKTEWGKGCGYQSIMLLLDFAFNILNLNRVNAHVYAPNISSRNLFIKCGFEIEGIERQKVWFNGTHVDVVNFGKLRANHDFGWKNNLGDRRDRLIRESIH